MALSANWHKASYSNGSGGNNCVEASIGKGTSAKASGMVVKVRDSKDKDGPVLEFTKDEWAAFLAGAADGEFSLPANMT